MKKEIKLENVLFIGVIVVIVHILTIYMFMNRINGYEEKLERSNDAYEKVVIENDDLKDRINDLKDHINELDSNIYNVFNKQPYELTIEHGDSTITYEQDRFGLFDSYHCIITKSSIIGE